MSERYERLEEIQEIVRVLGNDAEFLRCALGSRSIQDAVSKEEMTNRASTSEPSSPLWKRSSNSTKSSYSIS